MPHLQALSIAPPKLDVKPLETSKGLWRGRGDSLGYNGEVSVYPRIVNLIQKIELEGDDRVNMIAIAKIGKNYVIGRNRYDRKPKSYFGYPPISGVHAELDLFLKINSLGLLEEKIDFIFVFGKRKRFLQNTKPCIYCSNILRNLRFKYIYYFEKGNLIKKTKEEFLLEEGFKDYFI